MGLVITVWRGVKQPKINTRATPCSSCIAFRAVSLDMDGDHVAARLNFSTSAFFGRVQSCNTFFHSFSILFNLFLKDVRYWNWIHDLDLRSTRMIQDNQLLFLFLRIAPKNGFAALLPQLGPCAWKHWCAFWTWKNVFWLQFVASVCIC